ncbi:MAG: pilus assembly protein TadG-related protein [Chloroflexota bacterium]|jgi:hypothetical protein
MKPAHLDSSTLDRQALTRLLRGVRERTRERGQVLPLFVLMSVVLLGGAALLTDVAWWWVNEQRMQRAADAGALAGAIHLPGNEALAFQRALTETAKNGYANGVDGVTVTPRRDPGDPRKLVVDIDGPVGTNFARALCWDGGPCLRSVDVGVSGAATFVLPVPMGSPENYYGVFGKLRTPDGGMTVTGPLNVTQAGSPASGAGGRWTATSGSVAAAVRSTDGVYAQSNVDRRTQAFTGFGLHGPGGLPVSGAEEIVGIEVLLDALVSGTCRDSYVAVHLSKDGGVSWSSPARAEDNDTPDLGTTPGDYVVGSSMDLDAFRTSDGWDRDDFGDGRFVVRLRAEKGCSDRSRYLQVDQVRVRVHYRSSTFVADANVDDPYGDPLEPRGFWGTFINQGAEKINGDAYLPKWDPRRSANDQYDPETYYNYAIEMPAGAGNGELWIFDPVFCATNGNGAYGTGDRWFGSAREATSAFYTLYDTNETPYLFADDRVVARSGSLFRGIRASDPTLGGPTGPGIADCSAGATDDESDGRYWHNRWWQLTSSAKLEGGKTYRLHTRSTDPGDPSAMDDANGHNSFSLWARASGSGSPRIYGLGAMQAYTPLDRGQPATFYLAQIDAEHAGKTMVINLWDPGDTRDLSASLRILRPTSTAYVETPFSHSAEPVAAGARPCGSRTGRNVMSVTTNSGGSSNYNGCWLTLEIPLPADYDAPRPSTEDPSVEGGWWKIRYIMGNESDQPAFDLTTWQVELRGNPVHLVLD